MTINKSQGQYLSICSFNQENPCFSHGQLYVACSRVVKPSVLYVYAPSNQTKSIVYHKQLERVSSSLYPKMLRKTIPTFLLLSFDEMKSVRAARMT